jgi:hypothetical protein
VTERFGNIPPAVKRAFWWLSLLAYLILAACGLIGLTWPRVGMTPVEWFTARTAGVAMFVSALLCAVSYPVHRWRWELLGSWAVGTATAVYVLVILSVAPFADRGLLVLGWALVVIGVYCRGLQLIAFGRKTTRAREHALEEASDGEG